MLRRSVCGAARASGGDVDVYCRYEQAQTKLDKLEGRAGSFEHVNGVVKDQNETLAKELSALHRQVGGGRVAHGV